MIISVLIAFGLGMALNMLINDWERATTKSILDEVQPATVHPINKKQ